MKIEAYTSNRISIDATGFLALIHQLAAAVLFETFNFLNMAPTSLRAVFSQIPRNSGDFTVGLPLAQYLSYSLFPAVKIVFFRIRLDIKNGAVVI